MTNKRTKCDMCGSAIVEGKCDCGIWLECEKDYPEAMLSMKKALEDFHEEKRFTQTGDIPHLGVGCVYFRGDYNDCKKIEKFIHKMKGRPYYD